jgi:D-lactate dehydrogenase
VETPRARDTVALPFALVRVSVFSTKPYDRDFLNAANVAHAHDLRFLEAPLDEHTAPLVRPGDAVCAFVNDRLNESVLQSLAAAQVPLIALRCAGFNNVDLSAAERFGITVARVPAYSPHAVAEHAVGLLLTLNRRLHKAYARVRDGNFSLTGLCGFDVHARSVGIVGTGRIGLAFARILHGFGCELLGHDPVRNPECEALGMKYVPLDELWASSDIISLHCPLTEATRHLVDHAALEKMKRGVVLINTSRGGLVDTRAAIVALKHGKLGFLGIDVYEEEEHLFFEDLSGQVIQDDVFMRLLTFPNVIVTAHQGFFTEDALREIAETTLSNLTAFASGTGTLHRVAR